MKPVKNCLVVIVFLLLFLAQPIPAQRPNDYGGQLIYSELLAHDNLNPYRTQNNATAIRLISLIYEGLVYYDYNHDKVVPALATSWELSATGRSVTFTLRSDVSWHDGTPFTANDVKFTIDYVKDAQNIPREKKNQFNFIRSAQVLNDLQIKILLKRKFSNPIMYFTFEIVPKHSFKPNFLPAEGGPGIGVRPIGTGPYKFKTVTLEGRVVLTANDGYWKARPHIQKFIRRLDSDPNTQVQALKLGAMDMILETRTSDVGPLQQTGLILVMSYPSLSYYFIAFNFTNPILQNKTIRKAFVYAVNRSEILKNFFNDKGEVISGPFTPRSWAYNPDVHPLPYNPDLAMDLLKQVGSKDTDGDNILEYNGLPMTFVLKVPINQAQSSPLANIALAFKNYMAKIGIEIKVENIPYARWQQDIFEEKKFDLTLSRWTFDPTFNISPLFHSSYTYKGGKNFISYRNIQIDNLLDRANNANDPIIIRGIYHKIHKLLSDDAPYLFLFTVNKFVAYHLKIFNVKIDPYYFFKDPEKWYIPKEWQQ